jgi:starch synthase
MYIAMVASECTPVAKVGGLADVVYGLSLELERRGHRVDIILPKYDCMRYDHVWNLQVAWEDLWVPWGDAAVHCTVYFGHVHGRSCYFIDPHSADNFFRRCAYYGSTDDHLRFAFFSKAALEFMLASNKRPDVIHTHDWQSALVPVLLYEIYRYQGLERQRACHTIHNFKHQGIVGDNVLQAVKLDRPAYYHQDERLQDEFNPSALNLTKGAVNYSNFITTVSPRHSWEARFTDQGNGLGHVLFRHQEKFGGVLNGLDYDMWNPQRDPLIPHHYSVDRLEPKYGNKNALRQRLLLQEVYKPIVAYVGRLDTQKGVHLIRHALFYALEHGCQFVLLGSSSEAGINEEFWQLKHQLNDNADCHLELAFDEELAHLIYAGADFIVMPSLFEPCGLTQMIALRYGAVPIVRSVGGLVDTVFDRDYSDRPSDERNGYVFNDADYPALESAMHRAIGLWYSFPSEFQQLLKNGMRCDHSWNQPGQDYLNIYEYIRHK